MSEIQLVGCVLPDPNDPANLYLLHRRDHNQWQLPGGEIDVWEEPEQAVIRHAEAKVGVQIAPENIRLLGSVASRQGGVTYKAGIYHAAAWQGDLILSEWGLYNGSMFCNVLKYGLGRIGLSPVVEDFARDVNNGKIPHWLRSPVQ